MNLPQNTVRTRIRIKRPPLVLRQVLEILKKGHRKDIPDGPVF
jgi:hypothetical protein